MIGGLTKRQRETFKFISEYCYRHDVSPTFDEIKDALGLKSKSGVFRLVSALEERKLIIRLKERSRGISLIEKKCPHCGKPI
jgi:repressor LexA